MARTAKNGPKTTQPRDQQPVPPPPPPPVSDATITGHNIPFPPYSSPAMPPTLDPHHDQAVNNIQPPEVNLLEDDSSADASRDETEVEYNEDDVNYLSSFPPGYRFCPSDKELILRYLKPKIEKVPLPKNMIMEVNIYKHHPSALSVKYKSYEGNEWYFFTPRDRKYQRGKRPNRKARGGYWKATGADKLIKSGRATVGYRKALVFYKGKPPRGVKTDWIMHEYRFSDAPAHHRVDLSDMRLDDWVLCRIYKKNGNKKKRSQKDDDTPDNTQQDKAEEEEEEEEDALDENKEESASGMGHSGPSGSHLQQPPPHVQPDYSLRYPSRQLQTSTDPAMLDAAPSAHLLPLCNMPPAEPMQYHQPRMQYCPEYQSGLTSQPWTNTSLDQILANANFPSGVLRPGASQDHRGFVDYNHGALMSTMGSQGTSQYLENLENEMRGIPDIDDYVPESMFGSQETLQDMVPGLTNYNSNASYYMSGSSGGLGNVNHSNHGASTPWTGPSRDVTSQDDTKLDNGDGNEPKPDAIRTSARFKMLAPGL